MAALTPTTENRHWAPSSLPPTAELSAEQELACALQVLAGLGFAENLGGHITWVDGPDTTMLVNPWGLWWSEVTASDICRVDDGGRVVSGPWDVTPAIHIHTGIHRSRADARVVVHNHPYWSTVLAALGDLPQIFHQTGCLYDGDMVFVDEYDGSVEDEAMGDDLAAAIGDHRVALLANHGVIVVGDSMADAVYRAASFDRQCRLAYDVLRAGGAPRTVPEPTRGAMQQALVERAAPVYWAGATRQLIKADPTILD